jgi:hypothetical protein
MIRRFEEGKYYKWIGPKNFNSNWNSDMEAWKDGASRKCISDGWRAAFIGISGTWDYSHVFQYFVETQLMECSGQYLLDF